MASTRDVKIITEYNNRVICFYNIYWSARAKLIRAFETDEMNTDRILYSPPTESTTTPHHSMTKTPTSSALFRIKPISDISELEGVKYCGQVFKSFLLFSSGSFLYVVDQVDLLTSV